MNDKVSRLAPTGKMDRDSDPRYVGKGDSAGDYRDARNVQRVTPEEGDMGSVEPALGNEFAFDLGSVSQQNKRYRITFDGDATKQHEVRFLSTQRDANMVVGTGPNGELQFNGAQGSFVSAFNTAISGSGVSWVLSVIGSDTVEIELASYPMYQWFLDSVGPDVADITCIAEAIPVDLAGPLKDIGSYDLLGDLFVFSTTQDNEPTAITPTIILVGPTSSGTYIGPLTSILFNGEHGLVQGQWIRITGSNEAFLNGLFVVHSVVDPQTVRIVTSTAWGAAPPVTTLGTPQVFIHPSGIGEIGVAQKNDNTDTWTYTRLLRSVELNFVSRWQVDCDAERDNRRTSFYFDDDYNTFRKFYYIGEYEQDGALGFVNDSNFYQYGSIQSQLYGFAPKPRVRIDFSEQIPSGGQLPSGNIRYFAVMKDQFGNESLPSDLSQFVITYKDSVDGLAIGENGGEITSKVNVMQLSDIDTTTFDEIALGYHIVIDGASSAFLNEFVPVSGETMLISHTGTEPSTSYDVGLLAAGKEDDYKYAKNLRIIDGRLVRSNLRKEEFRDLAEWFASFKHRICVKKLGETMPFPGQDAGEYKRPDHGFYFMGYMYNETYRMSGRAWLKDGSRSDWFWIDDIRIDPFLTNQANPNDNRRDQTGPDISTSFDLTETDPTLTDPYSRKKVLVPYIDFFGMNLSDKIGASSINEIIDFIEIGRCEVVPEVIACGMAVMSVKIKTVNEIPGPTSATNDLEELDGIYRGITLIGRTQAASPASGSIDTVNTSLGIGVRSGDRTASLETYHEHPFATALTINDMRPSLDTLLLLPDYVAENHPANIPNNYESPAYPPKISYPTTTGTTFYHNEYVKVRDGSTTKRAVGWQNHPYLYQHSLTSERRIASIYMPDAIYSNSELSAFSVIDFGEALLDLNQFAYRFIINSTNTNLASGAARYHVENTGITYNEYPIDKMDYIGEGERKNLFGASGLRRSFDGFRFQGLLNTTQNQPRIGMQDLWLLKKAAVVYVENGGIGFANTAKNTDYGVRYVQLFSRKEGKYGSIEASEYYSTGTFFSLSGMSGVLPKGNINTFGGDTFTQQTNIKNRFQNISARPAGTTPESWDAPFDADAGPGFGTGFIMYSQNRVNGSMRFTNEDQFVFLRDTQNMGTWAWDWRLIDRDTYSSSYTPSNFGLTQISGNYLSLTYTFDFPQRIHWSERKIYGELLDQFAVFLTLNIKDLDLKYGEIHHHEIVNGELLTLQDRKWMKQLFNARGELQTTEGNVGVIIGDASVLSRDGQTLSRYGTQNKWSCILGASDGGKDTLYWYNAENGLFMRFGADGTVVISERARFRSFANRAAKWLRGKDTPAFEQGIRAVWDDRSKEVIWTFTGWRTVAPWQNSGQFLVQSAVGTVVSNPNAPSDTYENLPRFFRCTVAHANSSSREPGVGADWQDFWEQVAYDDFEYYSVFTVAYNEMVNGFSTFYGHIPKTYLKWRDTFLSSHPTIRNLLFEHRKGLPGTWYGKAGVSEPKIEDAHIEMIMNDLPEQSKRYIAVEVLAEETPDLIEFRTKNQYTWADQPDFKVNDDQYRAPIGRDATATNDPQGDSRRMDGDYLRVKFVFPGQVMNRLHSIVVKFRDRLRTFRR